MSLRDVMSHSGTSGYAVAALMVSVATFLLLAAWVLSRPRREIDAQARTPLDDDPASWRGGPND